MPYCQGCRKPLPANARFCSSCGIPRRRKVLLPVLIGVVVLFVALGSRDDPKMEAARRADGLKDEAQTACRLTIKHNLKAPDSADFQWFDVRRVDQKKFYVATQVDAINSFGAKLRSKFGCAVDCTGDECTVTSIVEAN